VVPNVRISSLEFDQNYMQRAVTVSGKSPDWWRQVGAVLVCNDGFVVTACNIHMQTEYEVYMFGDPRSNYERGQLGKYTALHAEQGVITACAASPHSTQGSSLYVTTFPCENCAREIAACGVARVFFREGYSALNAQEVLQSRGIEIIQVINDPGSA
jgi:deoxycytidylate deaminase